MPEVKTTVVSYEEFTSIDFTPPSTFYVMSATQDYYFFHTSKRDVAQAEADELFGKGRYTVKASKMQKTKSKMESGGYSAIGVGTTRGQKR